MSAETYDFRKPGRLPGDFEHRLGAWLRDSCNLAPATWTRTAGFRAEVSLRGLEIGRPADALARMEETALGYQANLEPAAITTLIVLPRSLALLLVTSALGDGSTAPPADRELTMVDEALCEYAVQDLLLAPLQEAWAGAEPVRVRLRQREPNLRRTRILPLDENIVVATFLIQGPFGEQQWHWLVPHQGLLELIAQSVQGPAGSQEAAVRPRLESTVREVPVEVSVQLGHARLPLHQLTRLRVGDLIILNQRVTEPLVALVARAQKLRGWPGRAGSRQAFQITAPCE